jgi:hypothetical protein
MITDIAQAIMTKFNETPAGDALRLVMTGGLWFTEAKDNVSFPYGVFTFDGSNVDEIAGPTRTGIETASVTVSLYSKNDDGGLQIFDIEEKWLDLFDSSVLTYPVGSKYSHVQITRMSTINRGKIDNVWTFALLYDVMYSY